MEDRPDEVLVDVGRRIAEVRRGAGLTQRQLAQRAGVSLQYIQRVEHGRENLTVKSLYRFAMLLDVTLQTLLEPPRSREVRRGRPKKSGGRPAVARAAAKKKPRRNAGDLNA